MQKIDAWLKASANLKTLAGTARRLTELQQRYACLAPPRLVKASRVKAVRAGVLVIAADNPAVAAKLRQLVPRLLIHIRKNEPEVTGIQIEVQVNFRTESPAAALAAKALSVETIEQFRKLGERVSSPDLQSALGRLVRRRLKAD